VWTSFIGFMASGKSAAVGGLSTTLGGFPVDLDEEVASLARKSVAEIFTAGGPTLFRSLEKEALGGLEPTAPLLIATGGGCVESAASVEILRRRGVVIWLDAPWEVLRDRLAGEGAARRPLIDHLGWEGLESLYRRRCPLFAQAADFRLSTARTTVAVVAREAMFRSLLWRKRRRDGAA